MSSICFGSSVDIFCKNPAVVPKRPAINLPDVERPTITDRSFGVILGFIFAKTSFSRTSSIVLNFSFGGSLFSFPLYQLKNIAG